MTDDTGTVDIDRNQLNNYRLQDILATRREARKVRHGLKQERRLGREARATYRAAIEAHLTELHPLLMEFDRGRAYWHEADFGFLTVRPDDTDVRGNPHQEHKLVGLKCLFDLPDPVVASFDRWETVGFGRREKTTTVVESQPTFDQLDNIFLTTSQFLGEIGLTLDEDTEAQTIGNLSLSKTGDTANHDG